MKIFGMNFGRSEEPLTQSVDGYQSFSTPFMKVGKGNLSMPNVNRYYIQNGIVRFGDDNLYPQLLNQMYYTSSIHGSIINFITNSIIGGGYEIGKPDILSAIEKVDIKTFEKINKFKDMAYILTRDLVIHRRVCVLVDKSTSTTKLFRLDPSTIRNNEFNTEFSYSMDWSRGISKQLFKRYTPGCKEEKTLFVYQENTPGQDIYPIPNYNSILNWAFMDGEIPFFQKANIQSSIFPSAVVRKPSAFKSDDEKRAFKESFARTDQDRYGKVTVLVGNGLENTPEYIPVPTNNNDKLFTTTRKDLIDSICQAWSINPGIMGVKVAGSLGNNQELEMSYAIYEKSVVMPFRNKLTDIFNELIDIYELNQPLKINDYQIIEKEIKQQ
jgi:hypothetical protein